MAQVAGAADHSLVQLVARGEYILRAAFTGRVPTVPAASRVRDDARRAFREGLDAHDATERIDIGTLDQRFVGTNPSVVRAFHRFFLEPAVASIYRELRQRSPDH